MKVPGVSFKLGNLDTIKLHKKNKDCSLSIFTWMFVTSKKPVFFVCLFWVNLLKLKKLRLGKKNHSRFCKISEFAYD